MTFEEYQYNMHVPVNNTDSKFVLEANLSATDLEQFSTNKIYIQKKTQICNCTVGTILNTCTCVYVGNQAATVSNVVHN